ncbi:MAG: hypothetical protein GAK34_02165 [Delftia tsuruhatensis]|nr:MAG: hypothetical protein GAK34_02165 [Delftia tsuruhatensis]
MALPGPASAAWHLGLAFQYPSGLLCGLCLVFLLPLPAAAVLAALGTALYLDAFGLLAGGSYYAGFGPTAAPLLAHKPGAGHSQALHARGMASRDGQRVQRAGAGELPGGPRGFEQDTLGRITGGRDGHGIRHPGLAHQLPARLGGPCLPRAHEAAFHPFVDRFGASQLQQRLQLERSRADALVGYLSDEGRSGQSGQNRDQRHHHHHLDEGEATGPLPCAAWTAVARVTGVFHASVLLVAGEPCDRPASPAPLLLIDVYNRNAKAIWNTY